MKPEPPRIHVYAQPWNHQPAVLVANREGLLRLKMALEQALSRGVAVAEAFASDGEGFDLGVVLGEDENFWDRLQLPYTQPLSTPDDEQLTGMEVLYERLRSKS